MRFLGCTPQVAPDDGILIAVERAKPKRDGISQTGDIGNGTDRQFGHVCVDGGYRGKAGLICSLRAFPPVTDTVL
jgi:hypothetical protein